jgi:hypothetical protein
MRNVSDKSCRENQNTHFVFGIFFCAEIRAIHETVRKILVESGGTHMTISNNACALHAEYVLLITAVRNIL